MRSNGLRCPYRRATAKKGSSSCILEIQNIQNFSLHIRNSSKTIHPYCHTMTEHQMIVLLVIVSGLLVLLVRIVYVLPTQRKPRQTALRLEPTDELLMVFLGLGGHTGEMIRLLNQLPLENVKWRTYVILTGDANSAKRIEEFESGRRGQVDYVFVKRARNVGESLMSSVHSTTSSFVLIARQLASLRKLPTVLLLNGPGTCVPIAYVLFACKCAGLCSTRILYVESLARVSKLSMSGLLLRPIADRILVQWPQLTSKYTGVEYSGILV